MTAPDRRCGTCVLYVPWHPKRARHWGDGECGAIIDNTGTPSGAPVTAVGCGLKCQYWRPRGSAQEGT